MVIPIMIGIFANEAATGPWARGIIAAIVMFIDLRPADRYPAQRHPDRLCGQRMDPGLPPGGQRQPASTKRLRRRPGTAQQRNTEFGGVRSYTQIPYPEPVEGYAQKTNLLRNVLREVFL